MFEWFEQEASAIKTPRFHVIDGPPDAKLREAVLGSGLPVPSAYKEFVLKFGNARLYRNRRISFRIGIFAAPREAVLNNGTRIYHLGFHDGASVYVKRETRSGQHPIFEFESGSEEEVAASFEEWFSKSCALARSSYSKGRWAEILRGPKPFTEEEAEIIEARRLIHWRVVGIDADKNHILEITNTGRRSLCTLTIGVKSKDRRLNGAVRVNIRHVGPGQTALVHAGCYNDLLPCEQVELFSLPEPKPEDRDYYWEFRDDGLCD